MRTASRAAVAALLLLSSLGAMAHPVGGHRVSISSRTTAGGGHSHAPQGRSVSTAPRH